MGGGGVDGDEVIIEEKNSSYREIQIRKETRDCGLFSLRAGGDGGGGGVGGWGMGMSDYSYREIQIRKRTGDLSSVGAGRHQEKIQRQDVTALWLSRHSQH